LCIINMNTRINININININRKGEKIWLFLKT
jgi:hypothetical protein